MRYTTIGILFLSLAAAALLSYLAIKAQQVDLDQFNKTQLQIGELRQIDTGINEETLKARLAIITDYSRLRELYNRQGEVHRQLRSEPNAFTANPTQETRQTLLDYLDTSTRKEDLSKEFQNHNGLLRRSINSVPIANQDFLRALPGQWYQELLNPARELTKEALEYAANPLAGNAFVAQVWIDQLTERRDELEGTIRELLDNLLQHVSTVLSEKGRTDDVMLQLLAVDISTRLDRMTDEVNAAQRLLVEEQERWRLTLAAFSALLILLLVYAGFRLRSYYTALQQANEQLEQKVVERTESLSTALRQLKDSQAHLIQSEKMASLGQMVAGVAHEINTPLGYTKSNLFSAMRLIDEVEELINEHRKLLELLRDPTSTKDQIHEQSEKADKLYEDCNSYETFISMREALKDGDYGLAQISELVNNLKNFSRLDRARIDEYDVNSGLDNTLAIARHSIQNVLSVERDYDDLPKITCSPSQINQVFLNLITNAAQAMNGKGTLRISTRLEEEGVVIVFRDDGEGIPEEILNKIFDPFFTTKPTGVGTGLGLSIVHQIIQDHGGEIKVHSTPGKGTRFIIKLPLEVPNQRKEVTK